MFLNIQLVVLNPGRCPGLGLNRAVGADIKGHIFGNLSGIVGPEEKLI